MAQSALWTPDSARRRPQPGQRVLLCNGCGTKFPTEQRAVWQMHVNSCGRTNLDAIQQAAADREDAFTTVGDVEMSTWVKKKAAELGDPDEANRRLSGRKK